MVAEIISIGNELLGGETVNTNASFIARKLSDVGVETRWITTIGDDENEIFSSLKVAEKRADVIIATGGLGPTHDDITKDVFTRYFNGELVFKEEILNKLRERFRQRNLPMSRCNEQQAYVPDNAKIVENEIGTAPGLLFEKGKKLFFVLPGVPAEMEQIVTDSIAPLLKQRQTKVILKRVIHTLGIPESTLFASLGDIDELEKFCKIAFLPQTGRVDVRLTATGFSAENCRENILAVEKIILEKAGQFVWGFDDDTLEKIVVSRLKQKQQKLAIVEIGTEGKIVSDLLENYPEGEAQISGFVFSEKAAMEHFFEIDAAPEALAKKTLPKDFQKLLRQKAKSDLLLFVNFEHRESFQGTIGFFDGKNNFQKKETYSIKKPVALKRFVTSCVGVLYHYLKD